jgi:hypothetical protein
MDRAKLQIVYFDELDPANAWRFELNNQLGSSQKISKFSVTSILAEYALSNTNENATVTKSKKNVKLNKAFSESASTGDIFPDLPADTTQIRQHTSM